jgi:hypothetical protein
MIVHTTYGPTNTNAGEILDLSPLARKPRGRVSRPKRSNTRKRIGTRKGNDALFSLALVATGLVLSVGLMN